MLPQQDFVTQPSGSWAVPFVPPPRGPRVSRPSNDLQPPPPPRMQPPMGGAWYSGKPCSQFTKSGSCSFGRKCKFSHVERLPVGVHGGRLAAGVGLGPGTKAAAPPCFQYKDTGQCRFGSECKFSHGGIQTALVRGGGPATGGGRGSSESDAAPLCFQYRDSGLCRFGSACKFSHTGKVKQSGATVTARKVGLQCPQFKDTGSCWRGDSCWFKDSHRPAMMA